jgi:hypothetical protein
MNRHVRSDRIGRDQLIERLERSSIDVEAAAADPRLAEVPLERADRDGDGRLQGREELGALFDLLDRYDRDGSRRSVRVRSRRGRPTAVASKIAAVAEHGADEALRSASRVAPRRESNDRVLFVGVSRGAGYEAEVLRRSGAAVERVRDHGTEGDFAVRGRAFDLHDEPGIRAFARSLRLSPRQTERVATALARTPVSGRDELAQVARHWAAAERGRPSASRLVLSGHHASGSDRIYGEGGRLSVPALRELAGALPHGAAAVEDLHVAACNFGHAPEMAMWRAIFPNLRSVWAYAEGQAPGSYNGAATHLTHWERASRGPRDDLRAEGVAASRKGDNVATWSTGEGYAKNE